MWFWKVQPGCSEGVLLSTGSRSPLLGVSPVSTVKAEAQPAAVGELLGIPVGAQVQVHLPVARSQPGLRHADQQVLQAALLQVR